MASWARYPRIPEGQWWTVRDQFRRKIPVAVTPSYLTSLLGVSEKTVKNLIPPLRQLGLIDDEGKPTLRADDWQRDSRYADVCRQMVNDVYPQELRDLYQGADIDHERCAAWFRQVGLGAASAKRVASLYILLNDATPKASGETRRQTRRTRKDATEEPAQGEGPVGATVVQPDTQPAEHEISAAAEGDREMADYPYVFATKRLGEYFEKIQEVGQPDVADADFLQSIGFGTVNDRRILGVWESIGFIDESKKPTERWSKHFNKDHAPRVLAGAIREAYSDLFRTYSNAHEQKDKALSNIIRTTNPKASPNVVSRIVTTFKGLCERADFDDDTGEANEVETDIPAASDVPQAEEGAAPVVRPAVAVTSTRSQPTVHINLQVHISPEAGPEQIDQIFASMANHLYDK